MKKIIFLISLIFLISQKTNAEFLIDYHRWLTENKQTQFLNKEGKLKKWLLDDYDKGKLGERFKWGFQSKFGKIALPSVSLQQTAR